ncbi:MAG: formylglycine-generating enzyme family protein [Vicinamibacterales bacterium]
MFRPLLLALSGALLLAGPVSAQTSPAATPALGWVRIPAGTFTMGCVPTDMRCGADERPRHTVTISKAFELMAAEVTLGQFRAAITEVDPQPVWSTTPDHPVVSVDWDEAVAFCRAVGARLPTESEWEYAARGGRADTIYPWGDNAPTDRSDVANGAAFEGDSARPVRSFGANGFGLYDMVGNVWEWVSDFGGLYATDSATDPTGPATGRVRVVRGGAYGDDAANLRISNRTPNAPDRINVNVGVRCARDVAP